jgi:hypothetical protein
VVGNQRHIPGTPVLLFNDGRTHPIARGVISTHTQLSQFDTINITPTRCVIEVREVIIPGAIVLNGTSKRKSLQEFGMVPFHSVCLRSHLRTDPGLQVETTSPGLSKLQPPSNSPNPAPISITTESALNTGIQAEIGEDDTPSLADSLDAHIGNLTLNMPDTAASEEYTVQQTHEIDTSSQEEGQRVLSATPDWSKLIRSQTLKDAFHVFNMFYISAGHGLRIEFALVLRDAIFIPDQQDKCGMGSYTKSSLRLAPAGSEAQQMALASL